MFGLGFILKLLAPRIGENAAKFVAYVVLPLILAGLLYWFISSRIENYGDRRYNEGVTAERTAWEDAKTKLEEQARASATQADDRAVKRLEEHKEQIDADRKAVDEAMENGTSPLDAIFGG